MKIQVVDRRNKQLAAFDLPSQTPVTELQALLHRARTSSESAIDLFVFVWRRCSSRRSAAREPTRHKIVATLSLASSQILRSRRRTHSARWHAMSRAEVPSRAAAPVDRWRCGSLSLSLSLCGSLSIQALVSYILTEKVGRVAGGVEVLQPGKTLADYPALLNEGATVLFKDLGTSELSSRCS